MKKDYFIISGFMMLPLCLTGIAYLFARDAISQYLDMFLLCGIMTVCLGAVCILQARKALKKGTFVGRPSNRIKVSGKKGEKQLLQAGFIVTGLFSIIFSIMIIVSTL